MSMKFLNQSRQMEVSRGLKNMIPMEVQAIKVPLITITSLKFKIK